MSPSPVAPPLSVRDHRVWENEYDISLLSPSPSLPTQYHSSLRLDSEELI